MNLRRKFDLFCFKNRNKGIPNLMMYMAIASAIVYVLSIADTNFTLYSWLYFDRDAILHGQVWRLFTYAFLYMPAGYPLTFDFVYMLITALSLYCLYSIGRAAEYSIGTFRFNLYYLSGIILQDIFAMVLNTPATIISLNTSMLLVFATCHPNFKLHLYMLIPIKAWVLVLLDFAFTAYEIYEMRGYFPYNLFPLVALANYFLFFGSDFFDIFPISWRARSTKDKPQKKTGTIPFPSPAPHQAEAPRQEAPYNHKCTVCGRTDTTNPELEFRYCSRCNGYHCYCEEHINNHEHIE